MTLMNRVKTGFTTIKVHVYWDVVCKSVINCNPCSIIKAPKQKHRIGKGNDIALQHSWSRPILPTIALILVTFITFFIIPSVSPSTKVSS